MKGSPVVIDLLMQAATMEAALVTQYHLDKVDAKFQRLKCVAKKLSEFGEDCESYLKEIDQHIFFLGGSPAYSGGSASTSATITELYTRALACEVALVTAFNEFAIVCMNAKDDNTRNKFEHWIKWHEDNHIDWLEGQLASIEALGGEQQYLQITIKVG